MRRAILPVLMAVVLAGCTGTDSHSVGADGGSARSSSTTSSTGSTTTTTPPAPVAEVAAWKLPAALSRTACAVSGGQVRCYSGLNAARTSTPNILQIDPAAGTVALAGRLTTAVHDAAGTEFQGKALLLGGGAHESGSTAVLDVTGNPTRLGSLPQPRSDLSAAVSGGRLIVLGGYDDTNITPGVLGSADGVTFTQIGTLATPVRYGAVAEVDGTVYVFGGKTREGGADSQTSDIQAVDAATGKVTVVGHLPQPMGHMVAGVIGGSVYAMGGRSGTGTRLTDSAAVWRFDPATGAVAQVGSLPAPLSDSTLAVVGDTAYLIGGERGGTPLSQVVTVRPG